MQNITSAVLASKTVALIEDQIGLAQTMVALGMLRIVQVQDEHTSFEDICGDMYSKEANPEIDPDVLKQEKAAYRRRVNKVGVFDVLVQARTLPCADWVNVETLGGNVGMDFVGSGYDSDFMHAGLDWLVKNADIAGIKAMVEKL